MKVAYNDCYGGFRLSEEAEKLYKELGGKNSQCRHDPVLIQVIEKLGKAANSASSHIRLQTIVGNKYFIKNYDGKETVLEPSDIPWIEVENDM